MNENNLVDNNNNNNNTNNNNNQDCTNEFEKKEKNNILNFIGMLISIEGNLSYLYQLRFDSLHKFSEKKKNNKLLEDKYRKKIESYN